ncbi:MAG: PaaI family thioesterase [Eubacteriales bacterium]
MDYLKIAKEIFAGDKFATDVTGIEILEVEKGYAKCKLDVERRHKNAVDMVMGGVVFTLGDFAFAVAANAGGLTTVTQTAQVNFLSSTRQNEIFAEAHCVKDGKATSYYEVSVKDDLDKLLARVSINGFKIK